MNLFDANLVKVDGKYAVSMGGHTVVLSEEKQAKLAANNVEEQEITLGVRPEHLALEDEGVDSVIDVHELMGSSIHLHVNALGKDVIVIVSTMNMTGAEVDALSAGVKVKIGFTGNVCHVFSKETGVNLEA
jgi:multiple sugar transport system ATP-binding protein